ncbi:hypothetical protein Golax_018282, partial [Gossypium laxum]|nr:hypothetical protein [Gossypium laxum]
MQNFDNAGASDSRSDGDRNTKKDKLLGGGAVIFGMACNDPSEGSESDFELLEGDNSEYYNRVLTQGPWIIYDQYLTVQPWTKDFTLSQPYPSVHSQRDLRDNDVVKTRKKLLGSRFMALNAVGEMGNGNGEADEGISGGKDKENVNKALGGNKAKVKEIPKEGLNFSNSAGRGGSAGLKSSMGLAKPTSFGSMGTVNLGSNLVDNSTGDGLDFEVDSQGDMDSGVQENINFGNFEENKTHYNPTFEELEGIGVLITDGVLDPGKHSAGCASVKFPRVFQEYNMENKHDIISLIEPRASGTKTDSIIVKLGSALFERLDRTLGNEAWVHNFPNNLITHLLKVKSHHKPLLLSLNLEVILLRGQPFQFLARWAEHPVFEYFVGVGECTASRRTPLEIKRRDAT